MKDTALFDSVESFQKLLIAAATGRGELGDDAKYTKLRQLVVRQWA